MIRNTERDRHKDRDRQAETEQVRQTKRQRERETEKESQTETETERKKSKQELIVSLLLPCYWYNALGKQPTFSLNAKQVHIINQEKNS